MDRDRRMDGWMLWHGNILHPPCHFFVFQADLHSSCPCVPRCPCWVALTFGL